MVKNMYKERIKSGINPLFSTILWFASIYLFYIVWGICEILFEFSFSLGKIAICLLVTIYYGWFLIYKILTEYEIEITEDAFTVKSILSKRTKILVYEKLSAIQKVSCDKKDLTAKVNIKLKRPFQNGKNAYITFKTGKKIKCIQIKASERFIKEVEKGTLEK